MYALKEQELQACTKAKLRPFTSLDQPSPRSKMSLQPQQQQLPQQQQQPVVVYPNTVTGQLAPPSVHHSNGSFGSVFIVLAVIIVVSAIACFLGRLCNRRYRSQKPKENHHYHNHHNHRPKQSGDIEFGFDKKGSAAKPGGNGGSRGHKGFETVDHIKGGMKPAEREGYLRTDA